MPILFLVMPVVCIFILNLPRREIGGRIAPWVTGAACLLQAAMAAVSRAPFWLALDSAYKLPDSLPLSIDYISAVILFTIPIVAASSTAVGLNRDTRKRLYLGSLTLMLMTGMNGVVMTRDLFSLYIFLEITAVSSFILIAVNKELYGLEGAFKYLILSALATAAMLSANAVIFMQAGSLRFADVADVIRSGNGAVQIALVLYVSAFCVKAGVAPFHGWLPGAYSAAPDPVSVLLAGIVTKVSGVYIVIRMMGSLFGGLIAPGRAFMFLGALSIVIGAFGAIAQTNMKRMLAYSSISQVGYIILAAGLGAPMALLGALLHFFNHAVFKSLLFVNAASVQEQAGSTDFDNLGGLAEKMKVTGWTSVAGFLSAAGVPPFSGFWSKLMIITALCAAGQWFYAALALLMSVVTLAYFLILQRKVFFGALREGLDDLREGRPSLRNTSVALASITALAGVLFPVLILAAGNNFF